MEAPAITKLVLIHLLIPHPQGPILGMNQRFMMCCNPKRTVLATPDNGEAASGDWRAINCPSCMKHEAYKAQRTFGSSISSMLPQ